MLYDLNIVWTPSTPAEELQRTLKFAKNLGYDVVALNHTISGSSIPNAPHQIVNPIPQLTPPHPSFPGGQTLSTPSFRPTTITTTNISTTASSAIPPSQRTQQPSSSPSPSPCLPTVLRRATVVVKDPATTNYRLPDVARAYDILAVRPEGEKAFSWACLNTTEPPALISLDLTQFLGWHIHYRTAMAAVARGSRFEISYGQALQQQGGNTGGVDAQRARSNFIGNVIGLLRATKGRGIVLTSEARSALGLRAPADVVNLLAVWGLGPERGFEALGAGARAVVVNEGVKRRGFRGVIDIVQPAPGGKSRGGDGGEEGDEAGKGHKKNKKQQQQQKKGNNQQLQQGQKRKNGDGVGGGSGGGDGAQQITLSKRQAKRMKNGAS